MKTPPLLALALLLFASPALATPKAKTLITVTSADTAKALKLVNDTLTALPGQAAVPAELKALLATAGKLPLSGPGVALLLRKPGKGAALAAALASPNPAKLSKALTRALPARHRKLLRIKTAKGRVMLYTAAWARAHLAARVKALLAPLKETAASFSMTIAMDNFIPARDGLESPGPMRIEGKPPTWWSTAAGPAVALALRPLLRRPAAPNLGLLPRGTELISVAKIGAHGKLLRQVIGSNELRKLFPALAGELLLAHLPDAADAVRAGMYLRFSGGKARDAADRIYAEVKKNIPWWRKVLKEDGIKAQKVGKDQYAFIYPISLAQRAALAAMGIKVPYPLVVRWGARGDYLVMATDEAFLSSKDRFDSKVPAKLKDAAAWSWHVTGGQINRLTWSSRQVLMEGSDLSSGGDRVNQILSMLPSLVLSWTIKQRVVEAFKIPAESMEPAIEQGDHVWVDRRLAGRAPKKGDIVVFRSPRQPGKDFIKRVTAVAGEEVVMVVVKVRKRRGKGKGKGKGKGRAMSKDRTITVPKGHVFLIGDNKDNSYDSRHFGPVKVSAIKGRAASVLWSTDDKGNIRWKRIGMVLK